MRIVKVTSSITTRLQVTVHTNLRGAVGKLILRLLLLMFDSRLEFFMHVNLKPARMTVCDHAPNLPNSKQVTLYCKLLLCCQKFDFLFIYRRRKLQKYTYF